MSLVLGQGRDHLSLSLIALKHVHGHVQDAEEGAVGQDLSLEEGDLYQKRSVKDLRSTDPSPGKEKEKDQAPGITGKLSELEVAPQVGGVGVTLRVVEEDLDLWGEGALVFPRADGAAPQADGAAPQVEGAAPRADGAAPRADGAEPRVDGAVPQADGAALLAVGEDRGLW